MTMKKLLFSVVIIFFVNLTFGQTRQTYLFVSGAWGGGWEYKKVDSILTAQGHKVYRPTMTGLGERVHLANAEISLSTHINDIVNVILFEDLRNITLVGHSYGGMVISGVAEQVPERIKKLIYLDAFVPNDGESIQKINGPAWEQMIVPIVKNGLISYPFGATKPLPPTDVPQPLKTFTETLKINNPLVPKISTTYILMMKDGKGDFIEWGASRAKKRGWPILTLEGGHYAMRDQPTELVKILEKCK